MHEHPRSGRNRIYTVVGVGRGGSIAKQGLVVPGREVWSIARSWPTSKEAPTCLFSDLRTSLVVLEEVRAARTLLREAMVKPESVFKAAERLVDILARIHSLDLPGAPPAAPAIPQLDPIDIHLWTQCGMAAREVVRYVQHSDILCEAMRTVVDDVAGHVFIHGDIKLDNLLLSGHRSTIIDWELCGRGPAGRDLGGLIGSAVTIWVDRIALDHLGDAHAILGRSRRYPIRAAADLFARYTKWISTRSKWESGSDLPSKDKVVAHIASWLVARTLADATLSYDLSPHQLLRLIVVENLIVDPFQLFGDLAVERSSTARLHAAVLGMAAIARRVFTKQASHSGLYRALRVRLYGSAIA